MNLLFNAIFCVCRVVISSLPDIQCDKIQCPIHFFSEQFLHSVV